MVQTRMVSPRPERRRGTRQVRDVAGKAALLAERGADSGIIYQKIFQIEIFISELLSAPAEHAGARVIIFIC